MFTSRRMQDEPNVKGAFSFLHQSEKLENIYTLTVIIIKILLTVPLVLFYWINSCFKKPKSLRNKICLITGAGQGIGRELSLQLFNEGAIIVCVDIREDANQETVNMIKSSGGEAYCYTCNIAKYDEVMQLAKTVQTEVGRVYLLINNAGLIMTHQVPNWSEEEVIAMFNVNVFSHFWALKVFLPIMQEENEGHIVNMVSVVSAISLPGLSIYNATKAAAASLINSARCEINFNENNNIKLSSIHPSLVNSNEDIKRFFHGLIPVLNLKETVKEIINGIKYEKEEICIPRSFYQFMAFAQHFISSRIIARFIANLNIKIFVPNKSYKEETAFNKIVKNCSDS